MFKDHIDKHIEVDEKLNYLDKLVDIREENDNLKEQNDRVNEYAVAVQSGLGVLFNFKSYLWRNTEVISILNLMYEEILHFSPCAWERVQMAQSSVLVIYGRNLVRWA